MQNLIKLSEPRVEITDYWLLEKITNYHNTISWNL